MRKIDVVAAIGLLVISTVPAFAQGGATKSVGAGSADDNDASSGGNSGAAAAAGGTGSTGGAGGGKRGHEGKHHGGGRGRQAKPPGKRQVLGISDLTDQQKTQLNSIYETNKKPFNDLRRQMSDLEQSEWQDVQKVLTPAQVNALNGSAPAGPGPGASDQNER